MDSQLYKVAAKIDFSGPNPTLKSQILIVKVPKSTPREPNLIRREATLTPRDPKSTLMGLKSTLRHNKSFSQSPKHGSWRRNLTPGSPRSIPTGLKLDHKNLKLTPRG